MRLDNLALTKIVWLVAGVVRVDYGHEWDALLAFKLGDVQVLTKYANYRADGFGVDTERFWLQLGIAY